jgi:hypothetical protein
MCIGRGAYAVSDVRDDTTLVSEIPGSSVEIYGPYTSPNSGDAPQLRIGDAINTQLLSTTKVGSVNGQVLQPEDSGGAYARTVRFTYPNIVQMLDPDIDLTELFLAGETIVISNAVQRQGTYSYSDTASFTMSSASDGSILVPGDVVAEWSTGQIVTVTNGYAEWQENTGGDDSNTYMRNADFSGSYAITGVSYDGENTVLDLDTVVSVNGAWRSLYQGLPAYVATGIPTLTRPDGVVQFDLSGTYNVGRCVRRQSRLAGARRKLRRCIQGLESNAFHAGPAMDWRFRHPYNPTYEPPYHELCCPERTIRR